MNHPQVFSLNEPTSSWIKRPTAVALGVFDGVHLGHQTLLKAMLATAKERDLQSAVVTFFPHPKKVVQKLTGRLYLMTLERRIETLLGLGIDIVVVSTFDQQMRQMRATDFVSLLQDRLDMRQIWSGDFGFGYKREGTADFLQQLTTDPPFTVHQFQELFFLDGDRVSSSRIRRGLKEGAMTDVQACLSRPYQLSGQVVQGDQRGRTIGFPTANLEVWSEQLIPAYGVYATLAKINGEDNVYPTATNIGVRPTVDGLNLRIEAHLLDFDRDIYGKTVTLEFVERVRPEMRFSGLDELKAQIAADIAHIRQLL